MKTGKRPHSADVARLGNVMGRSSVPPRYQARCWCGWRGHERDSRIAADDDCTAHDIAHNDMDKVWDK